MNRRIISPANVMMAIIIAIVLFILSANFWLWLVAAFCLLVAIIFVFDPRQIYPVLLWFVLYNWLTIIAAIINVDLIGVDLFDSLYGSNSVRAVVLSLIVIVIIAAGMALSIRIGGSLNILARDQAAAKYEHAVNMRSGVIAYFASVGIVVPIGFAANIVPQLQQPLVALYALKYVIIYLVAATVFSTGQRYLGLIVVLAVEILNGFTNYFGTFKEAFYIVLIALVAAPQRPSIRMRAFGIGSAVFVVMLSFLWSGVKPEYRSWVSGYTGEQVIVRSLDERIVWMMDNILTANSNYLDALQTILARIDTTSIYANVLANMDTGNVSDMPSRYLGGIEHVMTPRILFPDKGSIDDSAVATAFTGAVIDENTSISIGFIAEANYDFGVPWMFLPILLIGVAGGLAGRHFMTRDAPFVIRQAFTTTVLFGFFSFGTDFDKALGGFLMQWLVLALVLKFGYPFIAQWLSVRETARMRS